MKQGPHQQRHGPYTQIQPAPKKAKPQQERMHVWLTGRADRLRLFQRTLFRQTTPVSGDAVWFLYKLPSTPPCERRYA